MQSRVLVVDDDPTPCRPLEEALADRGFAVTSRTTVRAALAALESRGDYDAVLADLATPGCGLELVRLVRESDPDLPVVAVTAAGSCEGAVELVRHGAYDFVTKPLDPELTALVMERAVRYRALRDEVNRLRRAAGTGADFEELVGKSAAMRRVFEALERVARLDSPVWITGESGTGKQRVACALHRRSARAPGPFVAMNCATVPDVMLEAELFGKVPRPPFAPGGERAGIAGAIARAKGGTLFLDEIGAMSVPVQTKLLRVLAEGSFRAIGSEAALPFDARVVAASHRDLASLAARGRFRNELLAQLRVVEVPVPPLRARGTDVVELADHFVEQFARRVGREPPRISSAAAAALLRYDWPGNVRELQHAMERAVAASTGRAIVPTDLPRRIVQDACDRGLEQGVDQGIFGRLL